MASLNILVYLLFSIPIVYGLHPLIDRGQLHESLQTIDNPLCNCYGILLTNVSLSTNPNEFCYTYSVEYNHDLSICHRHEAMNIILGRCTHEKPKFSSRALRNAFISISPNSYSSVAMKLHRSSMLGLKIQNSDGIFNTKEQFTICMANINSEGVTSDNIQYLLPNGHVVSCSNHYNHNGLPCISAQPPTAEPTKAPHTANPTKPPTNIPTYEPTQLQTPLLTNAIDNTEFDNTEFDVCVNGVTIVPGLTLSIMKHTSLEIMRIEMIGPSNVWFAFGFGENVMENTYTLTVENAEYYVFERFLPASDATDITNAMQSNMFDTSSWNVNDIQMRAEDGQRIVTLTRPWNTAVDTYDFSDFFQCNMDSIPIISAMGNGLNMGYHSSREQASVTNMCGCDTPTIAPSLTPPLYLSDVCIVFDQSCNLDSHECNAYKDWISEFIISIDDGTHIRERICLLGMSLGIQVLVALDEEKDILKISEIIHEQSCGNSATNLYDALEAAQLQFESVTPPSDKHSMVIFSSCASTNANGQQNEMDICSLFNPTLLNINIYIINVLSIDGSIAGNKSNIDHTYLQCLTENNQDRIVVIHEENIDDASNVISTISSQIILNDWDDSSDIPIPQARSDMSLLMDNELYENKLLTKTSVSEVFSKPMRHIIEWIFILSMICIALNALCCTLCALRQSGALDGLFGKIDTSTAMIDGECCTVSESSSVHLNDLNDFNGFNDSGSMSDNITDKTSDSEHQIFEDKALLLGYNLNNENEDTPPIPDSINSLEIDVSLKTYLKNKNSQQNFDKFFI